MKFKRNKKAADVTADIPNIDILLSDVKASIDAVELAIENIEITQESPAFSFDVNAYVTTPDSGPNHKTAELRGTPKPAVVASPFGTGKALQLNGIDNGDGKAQGVKVDLKGLPSVFSVVDSVKITAKIVVFDYPTWARATIAGKANIDSTNPETDYVLYIKNDGVLVFELRGTDGNKYAFDFGSPLAKNTNLTVEGEFVDGVGVYLRVNGLEVFLNVFTERYATTNDNTDFQIGFERGYHPFSGIIEEVEVTSGATVIANYKFDDFIISEDKATETTLKLIKAKADNLDAPVSDIIEAIENIFPNNGTNIITSVIDTSGNNNHLGVIGRPDVVTSFLAGQGTALKFTNNNPSLGTGSERLKSASPDFKITQPFIIEMALQIWNISGSEYLIGVGFNSNDSIWAVQMQGGQVSFHVYDSGGVKRTVDQVAINTANTDIIIKAEWTGTEIKLTVNGVLETPVACGSIKTGNIAGYGPYNTISVGASNPYSQSPFYPSTGWAPIVLDNLKITVNGVIKGLYAFEDYTYAPDFATHEEQIAQTGVLEEIKTAIEAQAGLETVKRLTAAASQSDASANNNDAVIYGLIDSVDSPAGTAFGKGVKFNGGSYLQAPVAGFQPNTHGINFRGFIYPQILTPGESYVIASKGKIDGTEDWSVVLHGDGSITTTVKKSDNTVIAGPTFAAASVLENTLYFINFEWSVGTYFAYLALNEVGAGNVFIGLRGTDADNLLFIGGGSAGFLSFPGLMDELSFKNIHASTVTFTAPETTDADTAALFHFDETQLVADIATETTQEKNRVLLEAVKENTSALNLEATQLAVLAALNNLKTYTDGIEALLAAINSDTTTENTNLASVIAALDLIKGYVDNLESYTDGLETLLGTTNTLLTNVGNNTDTIESLIGTLNGYIDGIEGLITSTNSALATTNSALSTLNGYADGLETLIGSTNTLITTLNTYVDGLESALTTLNASFGAPADTAATSDTGTFSFIALFKRLLDKITNIFTAPSIYRNTALTNTDQTVKATAGDLYGWNIINPNLVPVYIKLYNDVIANVTVGTTVPVKTLFIPAAGTVFFMSNGQSLHNFTTAITVASVTGVADNNSAAPTTAIYAEIFYK